MTFSRFLASPKIPEQIYAHLCDQPRGRTALGILRDVFKVRNLRFKVADQLIQAVLCGDRRFTRNEAGRWCVCQMSGLPGRIWDSSYVVLDLEATGTNPLSHRVMEVGAVRIENGAVVDEFEVLINPRRKIPPYVASMTGISAAMVRRCPTIGEVLPAILEFVGDSVIVGHNVVFDQRFVSWEIVRCLGYALPNPSLCTLSLAKRLLGDEQTRFSIDALCEFYQLPTLNRHRALGDARACAGLFLLFLRTLDQRGVRTLAELKSFEQTGQLNGRNY
jgi:DNA polymerase III epsilon subunit family exonuclease